MDLVQLLNNLVSQISQLTQALTDAQKAADDLAKAKFDEGFAAGVASVPVTPGGSTQADIDAAVKAAVDPLNVQLAALQSQIDGIPAQIAQAKSDLKSQMKALAKDEEVDLESKIDAIV